MKITQGVLEDRMRMYEEAADHLTDNVYETAGERLQAKIVEAQIRAIAAKFYKKYSKSLSTK